ncbi:LysR substrate-binding domain-containing protein [Pelagibius sp. CAU 1746]|uniref:LysR substrate-binding domain-containing protein n=1 Tax=Pelagibius sp. CAU 1746 TaxID=3140370 RepID=UPI00325A4FCE
MNLRQIDAFRAVMIAGSVTHAAERLNVSQPAISRLIAELERSTDLTLFVRRRGGRLQPTAEAETFFREVEHSFTGLEKLRQSARDIRNFGSGYIRIACLPALAMGFIPKVIKRFRADYPKVSVSLQTRSSSTVRHWVGAQRIDFGLASPGPEAPGARSELFARVPGVCVMPEGHALARKAVIRPEDLEDLPFISLALEDRTRVLIDQLFEEAGVKRQSFIDTQYAATICGLVLEGAGISIISRFTARDFEDRGIVARPFSPSIHIDYNLYVPQHRPLSQIATSFIEVMNLCRDDFLAAEQTVKA